MSEGEGSKDPGEANEVLSSIRKLVADDAENDQTAEEVKASPLLLTPDQRVGDVQAVATDPVEDTPVEEPVSSLPPVGLRLVEVTEEEDATEDTPLSAPAAHFDETELKELVAEIVREELRGELGEKITRNIRKMVRREIAKALEEDDSDRLDI